MVGPGPGAEAPIFGVPMSWRKRPALDEEEGVGGGRPDVKGVIGVSGVGRLGVVMLRPPHLRHFGVALAVDGVVADGKEDAVLLFLPLRRGW